MIEDHLFEEARVFVVDDEYANVRLLEIILEQAGFRNVVSTMDPRTVVDTFRVFRPDIVLLDLNMPHLTGYQVLDLLQPDRSSHPVPIVILTADVSADAKHRALEQGASDFVTKPFDDIEVLLRVRNLLRTHFHGRLLEETVRERTQDLERSQLETVERLALAAEYRDDVTGLHARRVGIVSGQIAARLGLPEEQALLFTRAAPLHDVGKIGIPDSILLKRAKLTPSEFTLMKEHTVIGAKILAGSTSAILRLAEEIAMTHHERWDGQGYWGRAGSEIPLSGRIVAVADVFDALTHERPYKSAMPVPDAVAEIRANAGTQFDAAVVEAFLELEHHALVGSVCAPFTTKIGRTVS